jgi:endonuclease/exonuclease/phosphatase (EEP) superfamily protein YafD
MNRSATTLQLLILLSATAISIPLMLGFFGALHPAFDSFSHFRAHLAVLMALVVLPLLFTSFRLQAAAALVFALAAFSTTSNALAIAGMGPVHAGFDPKADNRAIYRLLQMNLRFDNETPEKVLSLIGRTRPDVITLNEVSNLWKGKLELLASAYPHKIVCPFPNGVFGVAILSRRPFAAGTEPHCYSRGAMAIATVDFGGDTGDGAAHHLGWPWPFEQKWQIGTMVEPLGLLGETAIMAGDFNAAPWSAAVRRVAELGGLRPMPSVGPTWLYIKLPEFLRFAGLEIDQVLSKGNVRIHSAARLENTGSDHLPVMVEFSLRPTDKNPADEPKTATAALASAGQPGS